MDHNPEGVRWGELPCLALVGLRNSEAESRGQTIEPPALPPADFVFPLPHKHQLQFVWLGGLFLGDLFLANLVKLKIGAHFPDLVLPNPQLNPWMLNNTSDLTIERIRVPPINYPRTEALLSAAVQHLTLSKLCATPRDTPHGEGIEILQLCYVLGFEKSRSMMELLPETTRFLSVKLCFEYALVVDDEL
jgi:hypothetical protein